MFTVFGITLRKFVKFSLKPKELVIPTRVRLLITLFLSVVPFVSQAQVESQIKGPNPLPIKSDTTVAPLDSIPPSTDTTAVNQDSVAIRQGGDIETTIKYSAKDSIRASIDGKKIWLYGQASITYGAIKLDAEEIEIDYAKSTLTAIGKRDSTGKILGYPIFQNGNEVYETHDIIYNFKTQHAKISQVRTKQGESIMFVQTAFKNEKNELFSRNNTYTTCDLEHPHFLIRSTKSKAIPNDKVVSGPFYFEFNDIPLPIGFLFGMFPAKRESSSGIIFPSYGEERRRGFNLRNFGYFFDINEYVKLAVTGDIYSKGGHAVYLNSNYMKRYKYQGSVNFSYSKTVTSDQIENPVSANDYRIAWSHSPKSKGTSRFSASVNAATATYNQNNNLNYGYNTSINSTSYNNITAKLSSTISYSKKFSGTPFSLGVNGSLNQDLQTKLVDLPFPNITLNMTNQYPFQRKDGRTGPLDNFSIGYSMAATNRITNNIGRVSPEATSDSIAPFTWDNMPYFLDHARKGVKHTIPISTSNKIFRYFTISPSINYDERWYFEKLDWSYVDQEGKQVLVADTTRGFNRIANYSVGAGLNTRIYGTFFFKRGNVKAIRHVINPSVSFGYTPDFTTNTNYFQKFTDNTGRVFYKSRHEGFVYGSSTYGRSGSIGFGVGNNLEMKVQTPKDSIARKVMLLNNLSINSSYNLMADSFNLAPFSLSANSNILDNLVNINLSASLDPYTYLTDAEGIERRIDEYVWKSGKLGRITTATLALSSNFNPKARDRQQESREKIAQSDLSAADKEFLIRNPEAYIDFEIPWSLQMGYNLSYTHPINRDPDVIQTVQFSGDLALSEKWKVNFQSGYHFESKEFTQTTITIARDLHCWTMRFWWVPFGKFQSYNFTINVKSTLLQDLKMERRKPFFDSL
jgi:hypothetical protein